MQWTQSSRRRRWQCLALAAAAVAAAVSVSAQPRRGADTFPDVELRTQYGERVRFRDLIRGRTVAIELMYTSCDYACPLETARLAQVQTLVGERMGRDIFFYSISIDPEHDTPAVLRTYAETYHAGPGWVFLTGTTAEIDRLSKALGLYSRPDPENKDGHTPTLLIGSEATGQWIRGSALDNAKLTATMLTSWVGGYQNAGPVRSYAEARPLPKFGNGEYVFATRCSVCHTIGGEPKVGPDLSGITRTRDRTWLARYIASPETMEQRGDPAAKRLRERYREIRMPNLELSDREIADVLDYLERVSIPARQ